MRKLLSLFAAALMAVSVMAGRAFDGTAVLYFNAAGGPNWWAGVDQTAYLKPVDGADVPVSGVVVSGNIYKFTIPVGTYQSLYIQRGTWNKTGNILLDGTEANNYISAFAENSADVTWTVYEAPAPAPLRVFDGSEKLYFNAAGGPNWWAGVDQTAYLKPAEGADVSVSGVVVSGNIYEFTIPAGGYQSLYIQRGTWNKTGNILLAGTEANNYISAFAENSADVTWDNYNPSAAPELIVYSIKTNWKDGGWDAGFKELTVNEDGTQSMTETYTGNGFNISPNFLGTNWYPVDKLNLVGGVAANDLVTISVNPNATSQEEVFTITKISSPEPEPELDPINVTVRVYTTVGAPKIWWWGGDIAAPTMDWEGRPSMNKEGETNWYSWTFDGVNATSGISYKITATEEKTFSGVKEDKCLDANLENLDCEYAPEPEPEPEPEPTPDHLYILGNVAGVDWHPADAAELTKDGDIFTGTYTFTDSEGTSYFAIISAKSASNDDWSPLNDHRYGSAQIITADAAPVALQKGNDNTCTILPGTYEITVDWANQTIAASTAEAPQPETTDITVRVYTTAGAPKIWWWSGDIAAPTMDWNDRPSMTKEGDTNWYNWTFEGVNATSGISYKITATAAEEEFTGIKEDKCYGYDLAEIDCESTPTPDPEPENITLYFVNTVGYEAVYAYIWDESNNPYKTYPGEEATLTAETLGDYAVYSYTFPETYTHIIFCNGQTGSDERKAFEDVIDPAKPYITEAGAVAELSGINVVEATISTYQYSTLYSDKALRIPAGVTVEYVSGVVDNALVRETLTDIIPANTGVMISGPANTEFTFVEAKTVDPIEGNLLKGTLTTETIAANGLVHYILSLNESDVFGLYWPYGTGTNHGVGAFTNQGGKAYLELPSDPAAAPRGFALRHEDTTTSIQTLDADAMVSTKVIRDGQLYIIRNSEIYTLQGVRVQ